MKDKLIYIIAALMIVFSMSACKNTQNAAAFAAESPYTGSTAEQVRLLKPDVAKKPAQTPESQPEISSTPKENEVPELMPDQIIGILERKLKTTDYGGIYVRKDEVIVLAVNKAPVLKVINDNNLGDAVTVLPAKYSVKALKSTYASLEKVFAKFDMSSLSTLVMENRVEIVVADYSDALNDFIKSLKYSGCVKVVISDEIEELV